MMRECRSSFFKYKIGQETLNQNEKFYFKLSKIEASPINIDDAGKTLCSLVGTVAWQYKLYSVHICLLHVCTVPALQADAEYLGHLHTAHTPVASPHSRPKNTDKGQVT